MAERTAEVRSSAAYLRQKRLVLLAASAVGIGLGVLYATHVPPQLSSTSLVLLAEGGGSGSAGGGDGEIATQVQIVLSAPVLDKAGASLTPALSARQVTERLVVEGATSRLISIEASSTRAQEAQALAQAVAKAYVDKLQANAVGVTGETVGNLETRESELTQQIQALQGRIGGIQARARGEDLKSPAGRQDNQLLDRYTADQSDLALEREKVKQKLDASATTTAAETATIAQPATPATGPDLLQRLSIWAVTGAILATACVAGVLLIRLRRDPRLRTRDDLADAVGSSVLADVRSRPQRSVAEWIALLETYRASAVDAWAFRRMLRAMAASQNGATPGRTNGKKGDGRLEHPPSITIVTLSGDRRGIAVGPQLAAFAAALGITTRLVVASGRDSAPSLWAACSADRALNVRPGLQLAAQTDDAPRALNGALRPPPREFDALLPGFPFGAASKELAEDRGTGGDGGRDAKVAATSDAIASTMDSVLGWSSDSVGAGYPESDSEATRSVSRVGRPGTSGEDPEPLPAVTTRRGATGRLRVVPKHESVEFTVVVAVVDRRKPTLRDVPPTAVTALAISPGVGTREELARLAVAADDDDGRRIDGILIADPDPADRTTGRRMLDERVRQAPLPVRMTGISQVPQSAAERGDRR